MRLSKKSEYACLALIDMAERYGKGPVRAVDIAERRSIPKKYLDQLMLQLRRAGYVRASRGVGGGYSLSRPPKDITLAEIIRLMDGPLAPVGSASEYFYEKTPVEQHAKLLGLLKEIRNMIAQRLENTTLDDLL